MKALIYDGPKAVSYREVPDPIPSQDNVLIKIKAVGICGSDMHAYLGHDAVSYTHLTLTTKRIV